jgi:hypothetical protein
MLQSVAGIGQEILPVGPRLADKIVTKHAASKDGQELYGRLWQLLTTVNRCDTAVENFGIERPGIGFPQTSSTN